MTLVGEAVSPYDRRWSTDRLDGKAKMRSWNELVAAHMTELFVSPDEPDHFDADWRQFALGPIDLNVIATTPQKVIRTAHMIDRSDEPDYELVYMRRGSMIICDGTRTDLVSEGDFALLCNKAPYEFLCDRSNLVYSTHVTESWLQSWLPDPDGFRDLPCELRKSWGRPLASLLAAISTNGLDDAAISRLVIADQAGSLLGLIGQSAGQHNGRNGATTLRRVRDLLRQRYTESDLTPSVLAHAAGISLRHLHGLFASANSTFGAELIELRLQHAAALLHPSNSEKRPISDIAYDVGFVDPSHFSRRFRARFGHTPSQWQVSGQRQI